MSIILTDIVKNSQTKPEIDWTKYAAHYDQMCSINPSYWEMIEAVIKAVIESSPQPQAKILDIGAGTGNLIAALANQISDVDYYHVDFDRGMNSLAQKKYLAISSNTRIAVIEKPVEECSFEPNFFDIITSTNAIYSFENPRQTLIQSLKWLKPGGKLIAVDFGRPQNVNDWATYLLKASIKNQGVLSTARIFVKNWEVARQNRNTEAAQGTGNYWVHDTGEFESMLKSVGFLVEDIAQCYRGYSDIAICKKIGLTQPVGNLKSASVEGT